jgi:hypothetical protein
MRRSSAAPRVVFSNVIFICRILQGSHGLATWDRAKVLRSFLA